MPFLLVAVVASAFCLFLVQPMLAKQILPWFGGTAAVWAACMVFFQAALLAGYIYAHLLTRFVRPRLQAIAHLCLLAASALALPVGLEGIARPAALDSRPEAQIVLILLRAIGLPFFVLSSTGPLMQAWLVRIHPGGRAYRFFAWSNLSCAVALLSFPFVLEPLLPLSTLNLLWSAAYTATGLALAGAAVLVFKRNPEEAHDEARAAETPPMRDRFAWIGYAALGTALMIGITNHLCQMVAPIPFLWTVPLLAYLLTFVAVFEREWYSRPLGMTMAGLAAVAMAWMIVYLPAGHILVLGIPAFVGGCFLTCFYCHGELARRKPHQVHLTEFYILVAAGGAAGTLVMAFVAPLCFEVYVELPFLLAILGLLMLAKVYRKYSTPVDMAAACCAVLTLAPAVAYVQRTTGQVAGGRNFFGAMRVEDEPAREGRPALRRLVHGWISHGSQFQDQERRRTPIAYYGPLSGPGVWFRYRKEPCRIGVVGLGAGTLAAYLRPGDSMRFYEINPMVTEFARRQFTYLRDARGETSVAVGDGRLLLETEAPNGFDLLVIDAFSGDSIPVHLITREALGHYRRHLRPGGIIAFHLSNLYLRLQPVVERLAEDQGLAVARVLDPGAVSQGLYPSSWALVGRAEDLSKLPVRPRPLEKGDLRGPLWTDDFSSLLTALE